MSKQHRDRLRKLHHRLVTGLDLEHSTVLSTLFSKEAISFQDKERIEAVRDPATQKTKLLQTISRRHDGAFTDLVRALIEENQPHLALELDPNGKFKLGLSNMFTNESFSKC